MYEQMIIDHYIASTFPNYTDKEDFLYSMQKKFYFKFVDAYGSILGKNDKEEFFIPNFYGQEDLWFEDEEEKDLVILFKDRVKIFVFKDNKVKYTEIYFDVDINFDNFGGKRAYYYHKNELVRFRTKKEFYDTLEEKYKFKDGEESISGPHFTVKIPLNVKWIYIF